MKKRIKIRKEIESIIFNSDKKQKVYFLLAQHVEESCLIPKNLRDITKLLFNIQKKWLKSYFEELKLLKDKNL